MTTTPDDLTRTRRNPGKLSMRWPVDEETSARLRKVIRLDPDEQLPMFRRLLRWLTRIR